MESSLNFSLKSSPASFIIPSLRFQLFSSSILDIAYLISQFLSWLSPVADAINSSTAADNIVVWSSSMSNPE